jgi:hypothetical protein
MQDKLKHVHSQAKGTSLQQEQSMETFLFGKVASVKRKAKA